MARTSFTLTDTFQQIATGACIITVVTPSSAGISLNDMASSTNSLNDTPEANDQFQQTEAIATFAKGLGTKITVDGVL